MLSDHDIRRALQVGDIELYHAHPLRLQPSSVDVTLAPQLLSWNTAALEVIDPKIDNSEHMVSYTLGEEGAVIYPGEFALASTVERVVLTSVVVARVEGKSSLGRLGLLVHCTAGFIDAGWDGQITLELYNAAPMPIRLYPGMPIAQLAFDWLQSPAEKPYTGKYQGQRGPVASRYHRNWNQELGTW